MLFLLWVMPRCSSFCLEDIVKQAWVVLTEINTHESVFIFKRNWEPYLQLWTGWFCFNWLCDSFSLLSPNICPTTFIHNSYKTGKEHISKMERKKRDTLWKHLLSCFGSSLWVLECFNHSVKTMPCNLAVQRPFTQPTRYSGAGIHSAGLDHQKFT